MSQFTLREKFIPRKAAVTKNQTRSPQMRISAGKWRELQLEKQYGELPRDALDSNRPVLQERPSLPSGISRHREGQVRAATQRMPCCGPDLHLPLQAATGGQPEGPGPGGQSLAVPAWAAGPPCSRLPWSPEVGLSFSFGWPRLNLTQLSLQRDAHPTPRCY